MRVIVTGSGTPIMEPNRAGPGVLVLTDGQAIQIDAGRNTTNRIVEAGVGLRQLSAVLITHHHSDHLVGLSDLAMSWWLEESAPFTDSALPVVAPDGPAADIAEHLLDVWQDEMVLRKGHTGRLGIARLEVHRFVATDEPAVVYEVGPVTVSAVRVRHEPVIPAVGYRVDSPNGAVAVSGDTAPCAEVERLASGADVLVHEAFRSAAVPAGLLSVPTELAAYHSEVRDVGEIAARAGVGTLVLTHCIPPPRTAGDVAGFTADVRDGGFAGPVIVAEDFATVEVTP